LKILIYTLVAGTKELLLLVLILLMGVIVFACLIYLAERRETNTLFPHIPISLWWAMVTITTLGYGDLRPTTWQGYIVGSMCAATGVLIIALTVPIVVNNFSVYYTFAQRTSGLKERRTEKEKQERRMSNMLKALKHMHIENVPGNLPIIGNGGSKNLLTRLRNNMKKRREVGDSYINIGNGNIRSESALSMASNHGDSNKQINIPIDEKTAQNGAVNRSFSMQSDINNLNVSSGSDNKAILDNKTPDSNLQNVRQVQQGSTLRVHPSPTPSKEHIDVSISDKTQSSPTPPEAHFDVSISDKTQSSPTPPEEHFDVSISDKTQSSPTPSKEHFDVSISDKTSTVSYHLQKPAISVSLPEPEVHVSGRKESLKIVDNITSEHHRLLPSGAYRCTQENDNESKT
jgi:hypothetical protein